MASPLDGVRVLDLTRVLSGPHCGRMLADLGAEVIKIEPPSGDLSRFASPRRNGLASYFVQQNVGKANISIDLTTDRGAELLLELCEHSDVLIENYRPGVMHDLGVDAATALSRNERLIFASISGYGQTGPWVHRRAFAPVVEAETGIIASQGNARGGDYTNDPHSHADVYTGMEAACAVLAALFQREHTGQGQHIDVSMAETMLYVNEHLHDALWPDEVEPGVIRSFQPGDYAVLEIGNGDQFIVSGHPAERGTFELFLEAIDRPELADDTRFVDTEARLAHYDELVEVLADFARTMPDAAAFEKRFNDAGLATGQVRQPGELVDTSWANERGVVVDVDDRTGGTFQIPNVPWRFSAAPDLRVDGTPKYRGEDNEMVLSEVLGYSADRIAELADNRIISSRLPS